MITVLFEETMTCHTSAILDNLFTDDSFDNLLSLFFFCSFSTNTNELSVVKMPSSSFRALLVQTVQQPLLSTLLSGFLCAS